MENYLDKDDLEYFKSIEDKLPINNSKFVNTIFEYGKPNIINYIIKNGKIKKYTFENLLYFVSNSNIYNKDLLDTIFSKNISKIKAEDLQIIINHSTHNEYIYLLFGKIVNLENIDELINIVIINLEKKLNFLQVRKILEDKFKNSIDIDEKFNKLLVKYNMYHNFDLLNIMEYAKFYNFNFTNNAYNYDIDNIYNINEILDILDRVSNDNYKINLSKDTIKKVCLIHIFKNIETDEIINNIDRIDKYSEFFKDNILDITIHNLLKLLHINTKLQNNIKIKKYFKEFLISKLVNSDDISNLNLHYLLYKNILKSDDFLDFIPEAYIKYIDSIELPYSNNKYRKFLEKNIDIIIDNIKDDNKHSDLINNIIVELLYHKIVDGNFDNFKKLSQKFLFSNNVVSNILDFKYDIVVDFMIKNRIPIIFFQNYVLSDNIKSSIILYKSVLDTYNFIENIKDKSNKKYYMLMKDYKNYVNKYSSIIKKVKKSISKDYKNLDNEEKVIYREFEKLFKNRKIEGNIPSI